MVRGIYILHDIVRVLTGRESYFAGPRFTGEGRVTPRIIKFGCGRWGENPVGTGETAGQFPGKAGGVKYLLSPGEDRRNLR